MKIDRIKKKEILDDIEYYWGTRCNHFDITCPVCFVYYLIDNDDWKPIIQRLKWNKSLQDEML